MIERPSSPAQAPGATAVYVAMHIAAFALPVVYALAWIALAVLVTTGAVQPF